MFKKLLRGLIAQKQADRRTELYRSLLRHEAQIGGQVFGPVPAGRRREFFCLDEHTWIWHEEWNDNGGQHIATTRYDVRPNGILKSQNGQYQPVGRDEAVRLYEAAQLYERRINTELYSAIA